MTHITERVSTSELTLSNFETISLITSSLLTLIGSLRASRSARTDWHFITTRFKTADLFLDKFKFLTY